MTRHAKYVCAETLVAIVINSAFSALFAWLVFYDRSEYPVWGRSGLALDFIPQTAVISLITVSVATLLTRRRVRAGKLAPRSQLRPFLPANTFVRASVIGVVATAVFGFVATVALARYWSPASPFAAVLAMKVAYGACVAATVAPVALWAALSDSGAIERSSARRTTT